MSSHRPCFLLVISWIFRSKNAHLVLLTVFLNCFQSLICFVTLYFSRFLLQLAFNQLLDCLVMLTIFKFFSQISFIVWANNWTISSKESIFDKLLVSISLKALINSVTKFFSSSLSLMIAHFLIWICSSKIGMVIVSGAWSETRHHLGWIEWLSSFSDPNLRNIRLRTEFESWLLLEYLVET